MGLRIYTGLGACVGAEAAGVCRGSASVLCWLDDEVVESSLIRLFSILFDVIVHYESCERHMNGLG